MNMLYERIMFGGAVIVNTKKSTGGETTILPDMHDFKQIITIYTGQRIICFICVTCKV